MKICLVCSSGGHFLELFNICHAWQGKEYFWVTFASEDTKSILKKEKVYWAHYPTNRSIRNMFRNLRLAWQALHKERPDVIISTGAGVAVPFMLMGRLMKIRTIYIESFIRTDNISLTGRFIYPFVDKFLVQWPELAEKYKKAEYHGQVI